MFFILKSIKIIFLFIFLNLIFNIKILKQFKNIKKIALENKS